MPILATGQISIVDLSDGKSLSCYITSNLPKTQIYDPNPGGGVSPDWSGAPSLTLTPVIFANQTALALTAAGLTLTWKRREGSGGETDLTDGEAVNGGMLTVSANKLSSVASGLLTYLCYATYADPETGLSVNVVADITFSQIKTAMNAESAWISGEQLFKYASDGSVTPSQVELTAHLANVTLSKWQYKTSSGAWADYPTTADNASIKVIRTSGSTALPANGALLWVSGGAHTGNIEFTAAEQAAGNPFWDENSGKVDFAKYAQRMGVPSIDYIYVLLGWNSAGETENSYKAEVRTFIGNVLAAYPQCQIVLMGLQVPARDGLGANYGATGIYCRYYDLMQHVWRLDRWYGGRHR